jgi:hypothetical protein
MKINRLFAQLGCLAICASVPTGTVYAGSISASAANFAVLAGTTVTNIGNSVITGDVGVSPGAAITGFPPGVVIGTIDSNDDEGSRE